jgi:hypothetical protein
MRGALAVLASIGATFAFVAPIAIAQVETPDTEVAQRDFDAAARAFERGSHEEALRLFRSAFDAVPRAAVRFNIAVCLERLGRLREAWLEVRAAIAAGDLTAEQLGRAEPEAERLRALLATLEVTGAPAGADVRVDGISVCSLPCTVEIDPGQHTISAHAAGASAERGVRADRGQRIAIELDVQSVPALSSGPLEVESDGGGATAASDGRAHDASGRGPGWLTIVGSTVAAIGIGGVIGFGLYTQSLHDQWLEGAPDAVRDDGLTMRALTNVSIGAAALGGVLVVIDLVLALLSGGSDRAWSGSPYQLALRALD